MRGAAIAVSNKPGAAHGWGGWGGEGMGSGLDSTVLGACGGGWVGLPSLAGSYTSDYVCDLPAAAAQSEGPSSGIICFNLFLP